MSNKQRRHRKSRRQRKIQNRSLPEQVLEWADRIPANHRSSSEGGELLENSNNIAFAISIRKRAPVFNNQTHLNGIFDAPKIDDSKLKTLTDFSALNLSNKTQNVVRANDSRVNHRKQNMTISWKTISK